MAATAELVSMAVYDGTTDDVLRLSGASGASYRLSVQPYDRTAPAMVSVWMKADAGMIVGVKALGKGFSVGATAAWRRLELAVEQPTEDCVVLSPEGDGALYLYECMVEARANRASDWSPAPEDVDEGIEQTSEALRGDIDRVRGEAEDALRAVRSLAVGGANLIDDSEQITITGTDDPATSYRLLADGLEAGQTYTFSMASATLVSGSAAGMTLEVVRTPEGGAAQVLSAQTLDFSGGHRKVTFVTPDDGAAYALRLYAGIKGSGNGVVVEIAKAKLETGTFATMWTPSHADTETRLVSLQSELNQTRESLSFMVTHVTEDVDGTLSDINSTFAFDGSDPNDPRLIIGTSESPMTMELSNSRLSFLWRGDPVAYFSDNKLYVTNVEAIERMSIGTPQNGYLEMVTTETGVGFMWRN